MSRVLFTGGPIVTFDGRPVSSLAIVHKHSPEGLAIHAYTAGTAYQAFDDDAAELRVGARADMVIIDRDITAIAGDEVSGAQVDETWVNGTAVFRR